MVQVFQESTQPIERFSLPESPTNLQSAPVIIRTALQEATTALNTAGVENAAANAEWLMAEVLGCPRPELPLHWSETLEATQIQRWQSLVDGRVDRIPLQHLLGTAEFCGLAFEINSSVLVPRPETELLAEAAWAVAAIKEESVVLDIGTGSGCLAVSVAVHAEETTIHALDISTAAINVARANAERHGVAERIIFHEGDARVALPGTCLFDVIVSNPPYIPSAEIESLQIEVRDHDPRLALDGGFDGLEFYRSLAISCLSRLRSDGRLLLEVGDGQGEVVADLITAQGGRVLEILPDLNNIERIVVASSDNS